MSRRRNIDRSGLFRKYSLVKAGGKIGGFLGVGIGRRRAIMSIFVIIK